jgi:release factor glutamine methyltransferase
MMQLSIEQCLVYTANKLKNAQIPSAHLEARILLQHATRRSLEYILMHSREILTLDAITVFQNSLSRRLKLEPIAYITGIKEFYGHEFIVNKHVLIPREDTELLVDTVIKSINRDHDIYSNDLENWNVKQSVSARSLDNLSEHTNSRQFCIHTSSNHSSIKILELGIGSGCISVSLLLHLPNATIIATDISHEAIEVAQQNAVKHKVNERLEIIHSNWFENLEEQKFDIITSNPPYISRNETCRMSLETLNYEPHLALFADDDGLKSYYIIAEYAKRFLKCGGKLIIEIGYKQEEKVSKIFSNYGYVIDHIYKDLQAHSRVYVLVC